MFRMAARYAMRHGAVRMVGGRAVPALLAWDLLMLANRTRQIPVVDRTLRRGATVAGDRARTVVAGLPGRRMPGGGRWLGGGRLRVGRRWRGEPPA
jgi:hypothetical protein